MKEDSERDRLQLLRSNIKDLAEACEDEDLLDLVFKLLAQG